MCTREEAERRRRSRRTGRGYRAQQSGASHSHAMKMKMDAGKARETNMILSSEGPYRRVIGRSSAIRIGLHCLPLRLDREGREEERWRLGEGLRRNGGVGIEDKGSE